MNLEQYSILVTLLVALLEVGVLVSLVAYLFAPQMRSRLQQIDYTLYIKSIGLVAVISTLGALVYQYVYQTPVCEFCWWQRIFMFPIDVIALGAIGYGIKGNERIIGILAAIGALFAGYHYYFHVQAVILDKAMSMPCSSIGIIPSCTESPVLVAGFVTIPLMAFVAFVAIIWLCFLARRASTHNNTV